ncbi:MAG: radical SAM protein [Deltaproteobacteria bacterium]|nr:radical SAM protein [Deltaproteobacteria bacterium]
MKTGILLIHGFSGSYNDFKPLAELLVNIYGADSVKNISLPGHIGGDVFEFDEEKFIEYISMGISSFRKQNRRIAIIGHSTGGNLALSFIHRDHYFPDLLILAGTPYIIDSSAYNRWIDHRKDRIEIPFSSVAGMVSMINRTARQSYDCSDKNLILLTGEKDKLVLPSDAFSWKTKFHNAKTHLVIAPQAGHDIFNGSVNSYSIDIVMRAIADIYDNCNYDISKLVSVEPDAQEFIQSSPFSKKHLNISPGVKVLTGSHTELNPAPVNDPLFANIEITTRCNFRCKYCARAFINKEGADMDMETYKRILDLLPHAYRVTLVGLGEPILHPRITEFIEIAKSLKRRVGLVTNASLMDGIISKELISAGLDSIAFSIDTVNQDAASSVRNGTDVEKIIINIRRFVEIAGSGRPIAKAVFTALSAETIPYFHELINTVSTLGVDIMMLTDLNFTHNLKDAIWQTADNELVKYIRNGVKNAFKNNLPVLSVHALEEFGLRQRYKDFLLLPPDQLFHRSARRQYCLSPWQTVPVDVNGNITMCDCQPENRVGNILTDPFNKIWRGDLMAAYRKRMISDDPPDACRICPRF